MRLVVGLALAVVAIAAVAVILSRSHGGRRSGPSGPPSPAEERAASAKAVSACDHLDRFQTLVEENGTVDAVRSELKAADSLAKAAAAIDAPRYQSLAGGVGALRIAIEHDDRDAARVGIDVVRTQCGAVRAGADSGTGSSTTSSTAGP